MNRKYTLVTACLMLVALAESAFAVSPSVTNVQAFQQQNAGRKVEIDYTLTDPDSPTVYVTVTISTDNGATYTMTPTLTTGDIGWVRPGGRRTIIWDAKTERPQEKWANCKAKVTADDSTGGVYPGQMIYIPAGSFLMGNNGHEPYSYSNELPQHSVTLSAYSIGKYEVTRGEYRAFMNAGGYSHQAWWSSAGWTWKGSKTQPQAYWADPVNWGTPPGQFTQGDNRPVVCVTYYEAEAFCNWAGGHLPTEAQWERAARWNASTSHPNVYPWGDTWNQEYCNNWYDTLYPGYQTAPVGSYSSHGSPSGCQDMAGNVWEWCQDWYKSYPGSSNPFDYTNSYRVLRGGGWGGNVDGCRCACRVDLGLYPNDCSISVGFRLAR